MNTTASSAGCLRVLCLHPRRWHRNVLVVQVVGIRSAGRVSNQVVFAVSSHVHRRQHVLPRTPRIVHGFARSQSCSARASRASRRLAPVTECRTTYLVSAPIGHICCLRRQEPSTPRCTSKRRHLCFSRSLRSYVFWTPQKVCLSFGPRRHFDTTCQRRWVDGGTKNPQITC